MCYHIHFSSSSSATSTLPIQSAATWVDLIPRTNQLLQNSHPNIVASAWVFIPLCCWFITNEGSPALQQWLLPFCLGCVANKSSKLPTFPTAQLGNVGKAIVFICIYTTHFIQKLDILHGCSSRFQRCYACFSTFPTVFPQFSHGKSQPSGACPWCPPLGGKIPLRRPCRSTRCSRPGSIQWTNHQEIQIISG